VTTKITVRFFASVKDELGRDAEELELPREVGTVGGLRAHLRARGGVYEEALAERKLMRMALNQDMVPATAPIKAGDEVAFFPPVTGG
jgi:molybdopterin synthase sulfur carrier subunit